MDTLISTETLAEMTSTSRRTWENKRWRGDGPPYVELSTRCIRYRLSDVLSWLADKNRKSTCDPGPEVSEGRV